MKTATDPRHQKRISILKDLFALSFHPHQKVHEETQKILELQVKVDEIIQKAAPEWPLDKVSKTDLAVLRLSVYELIFSKSEPPKVIIDEAVELAKEFGGASSGPFVNGVLGTVLKNHDQTN